MNPLNLNGPEFLVFYSICIVIASVLAIVARIVLSSRETHERTEVPKLDPWQLAYLRGGSHAVAQTAVIDLAAKKLAVGDPKLGRFIANKGNQLTPMDPIPNALYRAMQMGDGLRADRASSTIAYECDKIKQGLEETGVVQSLDQRIANVWPGILAFAAVFFLGLAKLVVGVSRDKPVGFLVLLLILSVAIAVILNYTPRITRLGKWAIENESKRMRTAQLETRHAREESQNSLADNMQLYAFHPLAIGFAAGGFSGLHGSDALDMNTRKLTERMQSAGGSGGDAGVSGCGSGDGGAGSSGCGGGGCGGGCGGCGS